MCNYLQINTLLHCGKSTRIVYRGVGSNQYIGELTIDMISAIDNYLCDFVYLPMVSTHIWQNFPKKCHFQIISDVQWWTKKFHPFLDSTYQNCMIFAKMGDGPCNYY